MMIESQIYTVYSPSLFWFGNPHWQYKCMEKQDLPLNTESDKIEKR